MPLAPRDLLAALVVPLVWGMGIVFAKAAIDHFPPILLMTLRFGLTAAILVWFVPRPRGLMTKIFLIALVSAAIQYSLTFTGLAGLDASTAALVIQLEVPFLVLLGSVLLGERPGLRRWVGIAIAFAGVAVIAGTPRALDAGSSMLLLVSGVFAWALGQIMVRRLGAQGGFGLIAWVAVFATPQLLVMSLIFEDNHLEYIAAAGWVVWSTVIYLAVVMTALGYGLWYSLLTRLPVPRVAPFLLLMPVFSVLGGVTVLGETLTLRVAAGGAVVIAGLGLILFERRRPAPATDSGG